MPSNFFLLCYNNNNNEKFILRHKMPRANSAVQANAQRTHDHDQDLLAYCRAFPPAKQGTILNTI